MWNRVPYKERDTSMRDTIDIIVWFLKCGISIEIFMSPDLILVSWRLIISQLTDDSNSCSSSLLACSPRNRRAALLLIMTTKHDDMTIIWTGCCASTDRSVNV